MNKFMTKEQIDTQKLTMKDLRPETPEILSGLCMNCDNVASCKFDKPEEGKWQCEEYA